MVTLMRSAAILNVRLNNSEAPDRCLPDYSNSTIQHTPRLKQEGFQFSFNEWFLRYTDGSID